MPRFFRDTLLFHHHIRIGRKGKPIVVSKIRTMKRGSHANREKVLVLISPKSPDTGPTTRERRRSALG